jgi:hypothetical protein
MIFKGCDADAATAITLACEGIFLGPGDPAADLCAAGFIAECPTLLRLIDNNNLTDTEACTHVRLC